MVNNQFSDAKSITELSIEKIKIALNNANADPNGDKIINLKIDSAAGSLTESINLMLHLSSIDTELVSECSGEVDLAGLLIVAGSKFSQRKAKSMTIFKLYEEDKSFGKKRKTLSTNENIVLEMLSTFSGGKKSKIKAKMLKGEKITATAAKSLGLIDEVEGFKDKYEKERNEFKKKANDNSEKEVG